jgi:formate dehydrogenase accessory protein FdhE
MPEGWDQRRRRAEQLAGKDEGASSLLAFYAIVLKGQGDIDRFLDTRSDWRPSGSLESDLAVLGPHVPAFVRAVTEAAPAALASEGHHLLDSPARAREERLLSWWAAPTDRDFFPKAILQPYAQRLADARVAPDGRTLSRAENRCPFCGGTPQLSVLHTTDAAGGGRRLLCATCLTAWPFRRVRCAHCGEEDERKLGYFHSPAFDHLRVDACDVCKRYLKTVDLTRLGVAVPLVDEVAGSALDILAREQGYEKIELNLVGL